MSALSLGELYVRLSLRNQQFATNLSAAAKKVDEFGKKVSEVGGKLGGLGVAGAAALAGFVRAAAEVNQGVAGDVKAVEGAFRALAVEVATAVQPAIKFLADAVGKLAGFIRNLSPETKALVGNIVGFGSGALVAVGAVSKLTGVITSLAPLAGVIAPLIVPLAGIALAVGAIILIAAVLREAWDTNFLGIRDTIQAVWEWLLGATSKVAEYFRGTASKIGEWFMIAFRTIASQWATTIGVLAKVARSLGMDKIAGGLESVAGFAEKLSQAATFGDAFDTLKDAGLDAFNFISSGFKKNMRDVLGGIKSKLEQLKKDWFSAPSLSVAAPDKDKGPEKAPAREKAERLSTSLNDASKEAKEFGKGLAPLMGQMKGMLLSKLPSNVGSVMNSAMQGFQSGGIWGAVIAAIIELIAGSEQFQVGMQVLSSVFSTISDSLGSIFEPLGRSLAAIGYIIEGVMKAFQPIFDWLGDLADLATPLLMAIGELLEAFSPLADSLNFVLKPILWILTLAFKGLFYAVKYLGLGVLYVVRAIAFVWDTFVSVIQWVLKVIDKIPFVDMGGAIKKLEGWKFGDDVDKSISKMNAMTWDSANAAAEKAKNDRLAGDAAKDAARAMNDLSDANLPSWYKVEASRFASADFMAPTGTSAVAQAAAAAANAVVETIMDPFGSGFGQPTTVNNNVVVTTQADDPRAVAAAVQKELERARVAQSGSSAGGSRPRPNRENVR